VPLQERPAVLDLIGNTPMVPISRMDTGVCKLFLKLESQNPGGSIKDRIGRSMIETAERDGALKENGTVIEATAGNTGLGLALVARAKGYRVVLVVPDKMSTEKVLHLKALGAQVHMTRSDVGKGHPEYYQDYAARLAREIPGAFYSDQFNNPANPLAHETSTGPEIWQQCGHDLDAIVVGVGSAGTLLAAALRFCREQTQPKRVVTFACDTGTRYLSKLYNDVWMIDEGLLAQRQYGDLRDLIARRAEDGRVIHVSPQDTLLTAFQRMRLADVQQLPVLEEGELVGVIDESDLLLQVQEDASRYSQPVRTAMSTALQTLAPDAGLAALRRVLDSGMVAIVADASGFHGLITRFDLLNHLRKAAR